MVGVAKRTLALSDGFRQHIEARNFTCAVALLRMQLDTAMRVYAASLVPSAEAYARAVLKGERIDRFMARDGKNQLSDAYLVRKLGETHPWVPELYRGSCNFVHFTKADIFPAVTLSEDKKGVKVRVSAKDLPMPDSDYFSVVDAFLMSMKLTLALARDWQAAKPRPDRAV